MFFLLIRTDRLLFGPYPSYSAALGAASRHWESEEDFEHATMNDDYSVMELTAPPV